MKESKIIIISTIILTLIGFFILYLMPLSALTMIAISIIIGLLFGLSLKSQEKRKKLILLSSIIILFLLVTIYLLIKPLNTQTMTGQINVIIQIVSLPSFWNILIYFAGLNITQILKIKSKNQNQPNIYNSPSL